jgi:hypothetical protein
VRYHYLWLIWSSGFLLPWIALYLLNPRLRGMIWRTSAATALLITRSDRAAVRP